MTQTEYIEAAFKAYFPLADITVDDTEPEEIHVHVLRGECTGEPDHSRLTSWVFTAGSDDDRYTFVRHGLDRHSPMPTDVITVPLMPEA